MDFIVHFLLDWGYIALFICMALENMNIPIPSEIILGFAGFLVSQHIFDFTTATIVATIAGLVGSLLSYYMGLKGGRNLMLRHTAKGGLGAKKIKFSQKLVREIRWLGGFYRSPSTGYSHLHFTPCRHR